MKRKRNKVDIDDLNKKIIHEKMKNPLYILNDLDLMLLNQPYNKKKTNLKK